METNESILTRSIVGLDERKVLGKMSSLRVDYDTQAVSHYIVMNASTNNAIALPFENAIAVGDTFITVQSYGSFVDANSQYRPDEAARLECVAFISPTNKRNHDGLPDFAR